MKALAGPSLVHVATHGFYTSDPADLPSSTVADHIVDRGSLRNIEVGHSDTWVALAADSTEVLDGLDRAGLAMTGANVSAEGILTARELAGFDWWGTQLVVLSACQTGVGAIWSGDGVYGMRRALVLAGVASQVVSLWSIDDSSTRELMRYYYAELIPGNGRAEALRRAKLRMIRQPSKSRYAHPRHWAAFIAAGEWRPLGTPARVMDPDTSGLVTSGADRSAPE